MLPMGDIYDEVMLAIEAFRCLPNLDAASVEKLKAEAAEAFACALESRGIDPTIYRLVVHIDDVVGPMCFVTGPGNRSWTLPEFERSVAN